MDSIQLYWIEDGVECGQESGRKELRLVDVLCKGNRRRVKPKSDEILLCVLELASVIIRQHFNRNVHPAARKFLWPLSLLTRA